MTGPWMVHRQLPFAVRFEWGLDGARSVASGADLAIVVDVLSFTTCVSVAVDRGATVFPYPWKDATAEDFAAHHAAQLAGPRGAGGLSLSPSSLRNARSLSRVVLPSPNGSALAHELAREVPLIAAVSLRNAAGERWPGGSLRPAVEDQIGAGAFIAGLAAAGRGGFTPEDGMEGFAPEAQAAMAVFNAAEPRLHEVLRGCSSGRELIGAGYADDVEIAAELDAGSAVALLRDGAFRQP